MISFITFHVDFDKNKIKQDTPLDKDNFYNYHLTLELMFKSIDFFHAHNRKIILTDENTDFSFLSSDVEICRSQFDSHQVMYSRLMCQYQFLLSHDFKTDLIFLDSDILINSGLEDIFWEDFAVGLTIRDFPEMPINGGVIYVNKSYPEQAKLFFSKLLNSYQEKYLDKSQWWGDQYAIADVVKYENLANKKSGLLEVDNIKILLLECQMYNFSPDYEFEVDIFTTHPSKVIHFKGERKKYMATYWNYNFANFSNEQLKDVIKQLQDNRCQLLNDISQLNQKKSILTTKLLSARNELEVMKSSKFWKLRQQWFKIKDFFTQTRKTI
ncbi:MAG: hypothetical protein QNJ18_04890 [Xenococcaceae cyanobacterium MO_167.B52]|nr:hypothetical protein [Xenococcaceae cyanobacterium MO_167.B52]